MAYETSSSSSVADLINKLRIFAEANGWTTDVNTARTDGPTGQVVLMHKGSFCVGFATSTSGGNSNDPSPRVSTFYFTGPYSGAANAMAQTGMSGTTNTNNMPGPFQAHHFFADGDYLHAVVEASPGSFRHFGVGVLEKAGAVTTGAYAHGSFWNYDSGYIGSLFSGRHALPFDDLGSEAVPAATIVRADSDALSPRHARVCDHAGNGGSAAGGYLRAGAMEHQAVGVGGLARFGPSTLTGTAPLLPLFCSVFRPSGNLSFVGAPLDMRAIRMDNIDPGELLTLGPDDWKVFPLIRKNGVSGQENSQGYGLAYRVVP